MWMATSTCKELAMGTTTLAISRRDMDGRLNLQGDKNGHHHLSSPCTEMGMGTTTLAIYRRDVYRHLHLYMGTCTFKR